MAKHSLRVRALSHPGSELERNTLLLESGGINQTRAAESRSQENSPVLEAGTGVTVRVTGLDRIGHGTKVLPKRCPDPLLASWLRARARN